VRATGFGYEVTGRLGASGVCELLLARSRQDGGAVILQVLRGAHLGDKALVRGFCQQAERALELVHPALARHLDVGRLRDGRPFLASERETGETAGARLRREGPLAPAQIAPLLGPVCEALEFARARGVTHGRVRLNALVLGDRGPRLTLFGLVGPDGRPPPAALDVHALGLVMFELATGTRPLVAPRRELTAMPLIDRCLRGELATPGQVGAQLQGRSPPRRRAALSLAAATVVGLAAAAGCLALLIPSDSQASQPRPRAQPPVRGLGPIAPPSVTLPAALRTLEHK
jgi:serine/threonine protein kinase